MGEGESQKGEPGAGMLQRLDTWDTSSLADPAPWASQQGMSGLMGSQACKHRREGILATPTFNASKRWRRQLSTHTPDQPPPPIPTTQPTFICEVGKVHVHVPLRPGRQRRLPQHLHHPLARACRAVRCCRGLPLPRLVCMLLLLGLSLLLDVLRCICCARCAWCARRPAQLGLHQRPLLEDVIERQPRRPWLVARLAAAGGAVLGGPVAECALRAPPRGLQGAGGR